jgi:hypothetical protein
MFSPTDNSDGWGKDQYDRNQRYEGTKYKLAGDLGAQAIDDFKNEKCVRTCSGLAG